MEKSIYQGTHLNKRKSRFVLSGKVLYFFKEKNERLNSFCV